MADSTASAAADGAYTAPLKVAIVEPRPEILQNVLTMSDDARVFDVHVLDDAASYFEVYGSSTGPDILLVGVDKEPEAALATAKRIVALAPTCGTIVYGQNATMDLLSSAMAAGARRYLAYPFDKDTLVAAINTVYEEMKPLVASTRMALPAFRTAGPAKVVERQHEPKVVAVFSPKGGVGTSTLAVNLACALGKMHRRVVIMDGNICFGNVGVFLNISPQRTLLQLIGDAQAIQESSVEETLLRHRSGIKALLSPVNPEEGEAVHGDHLRRIVSLLRKNHDYVIIDTWPSYDERVLAMLDVADQVLVPTGPELPSIKNLASFLRVAKLLDYPNDKLVPVLMRANSVAPGYLQDLETFLKQPLVWRVVSDGKRVTQSVNNGEPFVLTDPNAPVSQNIFALARMIDGNAEHEVAIGHPKPLPFWKRRFGLGKAS